MKKKSTVSLLTIFLGLFTAVSFAQQNNETEIRKLENMEAEAFTKKDTVTLVKLFSPNLVVNSPLNRVATFADGINLIRAGKLMLVLLRKKLKK